MEIEVDGVKYPCSQTMGALLRFAETTGKEVTELNPESVTELCTYLWCCVKSACEREGEEFNLTLMEFADRLTPEEMAEWNKALTEGAEDQEGSKKKTRRGSTNS